jgi:hypothetical protein
VSIGSERVTPKLTAALASKFAGLALAGVGREWPHAYQLLADKASDIVRPRKMHPAFFGCFDWHSSVHGHWTLARVLRLYPDLPSVPAIRAALGRSLTKKNLAGELAYFKAPGRRSFERPYGWGWLLALAAELRAGDDPDFQDWAAAILPLEKYIAESFRLFLPRLSYPVRSGVHSNTAWGMTLALDYARSVGDRPLAKVLHSRALKFYGSDKGAPAAWEPSGEDFLSPSLAEADLMSRVLPPAAYRRWLSGFLPGLGKGRPAALMSPPKGFDRRDPRQVHLDGLSLSRSWALNRIYSAGIGGRALRASAIRHTRAGLARVSSGDYAGEHWLASFALYLLTDST